MYPIGKKIYETKIAQNSFHQNYTSHIMNALADKYYEMNFFDKEILYCRHRKFMSHY